MVYIVVLVKLVNKWRTSQSSCLLLCPGHTGLVASLLANEAWSFSLIALVTIYNKAVGYDLHIHTKQQPCHRTSRGGWGVSSVACHASARVQIPSIEVEV